MANKWHSIDRRIYGEGDGSAHFAEASNAEQAEQIVREHNEREGLIETLVKVSKQNRPIPTIYGRWL